jgi:hypothetical protein
MALLGIQLVAAALLPFCCRAASYNLRHGTLKSNEVYWLRLDNFNNVQYSAPLSVGGQTLPVIYDTGSFEILVLSKLCHTCEAKHAVYDQGKSTSFAATVPNVVTEHLFGSGPVVSQKGFETVHLGGLDSQYAVQHMPFWQVLRHEIAVWDENAHFSGIVGLGHPDRIPEGFATPGNRDVTLLSALKARTFALCLQRNAVDAPGWLAMGPNIDAMPHAAGTVFRRVPVIGQSHWGVGMFDFHVPGIQAPDPCTPSCGAIIDSGTSLIAAPPAALPVVRKLSSMVAKDCSNLHQLPVLRFRLGDQVVELPPKAYVMKNQYLVSNGVMDNVFGQEQTVQTECIPAFMTINKESNHGPVWILGMPFLRYYFTIFDRVSKEIFITEATSDCQQASSGPIFVNATQGLHGSATVGSGFANRYAPADFEPNLVDPNGVRVPKWATDNSSTTILL